MEMLEKAATGDLASGLKKHCPFKKRSSQKYDPEQEDIPDDDRLDHEYEHEKNDGGALGRNMAAGSPGKQDTWNRAYIAEKIKPVLANDSLRIAGRERTEHDATEAVHLFNIEVIIEKINGKDRVTGISRIGDFKEGEPFRYTVAAHHCIPGNGSLKASKLFRCYMKKDGKISNGDISFTIEQNIGYNVNGAHNGVWLPGNYAMNAKELARSQRWRNKPLAWQSSYVAGLVAKLGLQFHDTHTGYNTAVKAMLDNIFDALVDHQEGCHYCLQKNNQQITPPFRIIRRLLNMSSVLRDYLRGAPKKWCLPYVASDKWQVVLTNPSARGVFQQKYKFQKKHQFNK